MSSHVSEHMALPLFVFSDIPTVDIVLCYSHVRASSLCEYTTHCFACEPVSRSFNVTLTSQHLITCCSQSLVRTQTQATLDMRSALDTTYRLIRITDPDVLNARDTLTFLQCTRDAARYLELNKLTFALSTTRDATRYPELSKPLGAPLGPRKPAGPYRWTRAFEHADVLLDLNHPNMSTISFNRP